MFRLAPMLLLLIPLAVPEAARAQTGPGAPNRQVLSINPLALVVLGYVSAEYERVLGQASTWGVSASHYDPDDGRYTSLDGKLRYYPQGRALHGISIGALVGYTAATAFGTSGDSASGIGVGFSFEHQWLMGHDERFAATIGVGGKRIYFFDDADEADTGLPFVRLSIGWAF